MMTEERVLPYFTTLKQELDRSGLLNNPSMIWNMDETHMTLSTETEKIVARKGSRYLHARAGSRETITLIACGNANGSLMPPHMIFKGKTRMALRSWDTENAPDGSVVSVSPTGWTKQGLPLLWFKEVFLKNIGTARPQMLIFDGHDSHHHVEIINAARENDIILVKLPPHTSNWLQPLDRTFFGPLKTKWKKQLGELMSQTGCTVGHGNFFKMFSSVWTAMKSEPTKLVNGFAATGICPYNPQAVPKEAFSPAKVYVQASGDGCNEFESGTAHASRTVESDASQSNVTEYTQNDELAATMLLDLSLSVSEKSLLESPDEPLLQSCFSLVDIGCVLHEDGTLEPATNNVLTTDTTATTVSSAESACPPDLALAAIECSLSNNQKKKYDGVLESNGDISNDMIFQAWKKYKCALIADDQHGTHADNDPLLSALSAPDSDEDVLPTVSIPCKPPKKVKSSDFFVITSEEAFKDKPSAQKRKQEKEKKKINATQRKTKPKNPKN